MKKLLILLIPVSLLAACGQKQSTDTKTTDSTTTITDSVQITKTVKNVLPGPVPNTVMTDEYVRHIGAIAYLWGWPMTNLHNRKALFEKLPEPGYVGGIVPAAPSNQICMLTDYVAPEERAVACPNQDVVYGFGLTDFTKDAVIIQVPDFGDRFWVYQMCDQRTDGYASLGKMYGSKPGFYLLTGPHWKGKVPDGIVKVFKCSTDLGVVAPRAFQSDDPADKAAIQPVIKQVLMYPLSQFDGKMKTKDWSKAPKFPADASATGETETKWVKPDVFFDELPAILKEVPLRPGEEALYGQIQAILTAAKKNPHIMAVMKQAAAEADKNMIDPLFQFVNVGYPVKYNWTTQRNGAQFGTDYLTRSACAKANIFVNKPVETKYFYQDLDSAGTRLSGNSKYTVTFAKGETPPVKGFWSLTLYNQHHFFSPNQLKRYSLGTKNKNLQYNADGSLTIYVQSTPPDASKLSNWLPAPKEIFSLYVRCYWPEESALNDSWTPPAVVKVK
ncbi:DUF1254 domain-containing protein [Mucilaginibacter jinjuensis]|uniref:DUF1254 domain-containing protein n=1 Tax=Mucilaginibacter jinjuensis TaxID=1176721 RepID=A0ABY7TA44_9SPHI|nr:DUF1254 domain-containing protein [Mucilaginibacter jinjuensis]WCT13093.1 DUF1254 domain-containing protein [Mucilaginibacter jinjuensis]